MPFAGSPTVIKRTFEGHSLRLFCVGLDLYSESKRTLTGVLEGKNAFDHLLGGAVRRGISVMVGLFRRVGSDFRTVFSEFSRL